MSKGSFRGRVSVFSVTSDWKPEKVDRIRVQRAGKYAVGVSDFDRDWILKLAVESGLTQTEVIRQMIESCVNAVSQGRRGYFG